MNSTFRKRFEAAADAAAIERLIAEETAACADLKHQLADQQDRLAAGVLNLEPDKLVVLQEEVRRYEDAVQLQDLRITKLNDELARRQKREAAAEIDGIRKRGQAIADAAVARVIKKLIPLYTAAAEELQAFEHADKQVRTINAELKAKCSEEPGVNLPEVQLVKQINPDCPNWVRLLTATKLPRPGGGSWLWPLPPQ